MYNYASGCRGDQDAMPFAILTRNPQLAKEIRDTAPSGVLSTLGFYLNRDDDEPGWIVVTLRLVRDAAFAIDTNLFAAWLCAKCKGHDCRIEHKGEMIPPEVVVIRRIASEDLKIDKND